MKNKKIFAVIIIILLLFAYQSAVKEANKIFPLNAEELDGVTGYMLWGNGESVSRFNTVAYNTQEELEWIADGLNRLELEPQNKVTSIWPEQHELSLSVYWKADETWPKRKTRAVEFFFVDNDTVVVEYMGEYTYYTCDYSVLLSDVANRGTNHFSIQFAKNESAETAAEVFVQEAYAEYLKHHVIWRDSITDYAVLDWGIYEISDDQTAVTGWVEYAFTPVLWNSPSVWAGNTGEATDEFEGMLQRYHQFMLEQQEDGTWICTEIGTSGIRLPENVELSTEENKITSNNASWEAFSTNKAFSMADLENDFVDYVEIESRAYYGERQENTTRVVGVVLDYATDNIVSNAAIYMDGVQITTTNEQGRFQIEYVPDGKYLWNIEAKGYYPAQYINYQIHSIEGASIFTFYVSSEFEIVKDRNDLIIG